MTIPPMLYHSLFKLSRIMACLNGEYRLFGSAALVLHGISNVSVNDIDVLVSPDLMQKLMARYHWQNMADGGNALFRSDVFISRKIGVKQVEFMSGMQLPDGDGAWKAFRFQTCHTCYIDGMSLYVPELSELQMLLDRFGRAKDIRRLQLIRRFEVLKRRR